MKLGKVLGAAGVMVAGALAVGGWMSTRGARADGSYDVAVSSPAFHGNGPKVLFDEAHNNIHRTGGKYKPFAQLVRNDGFVVTPTEEAFSLVGLRSYDVLVIANAKGDEHKFSSAFTPQECDAIQQWVREGGSLLLITDHFPLGPAAQSLADRFGIWGNGGEVADEQHHSAEGDSSMIVYSRANQLLADHPITRGRNPKEMIQKVMTFTGQSLRVNDPSASILRLAPSAQELNIVKVETHKGLFSETTDATLGDPVPAKGNSQLVALTYGKGRVVMSGEAAMLTAQIDQKGRRFGMNVPGIDNKQFTLNVMHWLAKVI